MLQKDLKVSKNFILIFVKILLIRQSIINRSCNLILLNNATPVNSNLSSPINSEVLKNESKFQFFNSMRENNNVKVTDKDKLLLDLFKFNPRSSSAPKIYSSRQLQFDNFAHLRYNEKYPLNSAKGIYEMEDNRKSLEYNQDRSKSYKIFGNSRTKIELLSQQSRCQCGIKEEKKGISLKKSNSLTVLKMKSIIYKERQKQNVIKLNKKQVF